MGHLSRARDTPPAKHNASRLTDRFRYKRTGDGSLSSDGEEGDGYAGSSAQCGAGRARRRAGGLWGTVGEGFAPRRGAARASWLRVWASPCRGGERTSGIRRRRALWRAESDEGRACTSRSSTQVVPPRAGTRCVPGLRRTWPARARNAAHRARACCRTWPRAVLMHSARFWFRAARILGDQTSCQWPGGMWGVGGARAVETADECHPDVVCVLCSCAQRRGAGQQGETRDAHTASVLEV